MPNKIFLKRTENNEPNENGEILVREYDLVGLGEVVGTAPDGTYEQYIGVVAEDLLVMVDTTLDVFAVSGNPLTTAIVGVPYSFELTASNGEAPYTVSFQNEPSWMSANSLVIEGTPDAAATTSGIIITVTDSTTGEAQTVDVPSFEIVTRLADITVDNNDLPVADALANAEEGMTLAGLRNLVSSDLGSATSENGNAVSAVANFTTDGAGYPVQANDTITAMSVTYSADGSESLVYEITNLNYVVSPSAVLQDLVFTRGLDPNIVPTNTADGDFFVDPAGSDANDGLTDATPFATIGAAIAAAEAAGGTNLILLRAGAYRDVLDFGGTTATFEIESYAGEAVDIKVSKQVTGWTQALASEVGATNAANIYKATVDITDWNGLDHVAYMNVYEGDTRCEISQDRTTYNGTFAWFDDSQFLTAESFGLDGNGDIETITDTVNLANYTQAQLQSALIPVYSGDNRVNVSFVSSFDEVNKVITLNTLHPAYTGTQPGDRYSIINAIDKMTVGTFGAINNGDGTATLFLWPNDPNNLEVNIEVSVSDILIDVGDFGGDLTFRNVRLLRPAGFGVNRGMCIGSATHATDVKTGKVTIENCVLGQTSGDNYGAVFLGGVQGGVDIISCEFIECGDSAVFVSSCHDIRVLFSSFTNIGSNAVKGFGNVRLTWAYCETNDVSRNTHNNFANFYQQSEFALIWGIKSVQMFGYITYSDSSGVIVGMSDLQCSYDDADERCIVDQVSTVPPDPTARNYILNNTIPPHDLSETGNAISTGSADMGPRYTVMNNVAHGLGDTLGVVDVRGGNVWSEMTAHLNSISKPATEAYQAPFQLWVDPEVNFPELRERALPRVRPVGDDLTSVIAELKTLWPQFQWFEHDVEGKVYDPALPPVGAYSDLPAAPAETLGTVAALVLDGSHGIALVEDVGFASSSQATISIDGVWTDDTDENWLMTEGLNTYLAINPAGTVRLRIENTNDEQMFFDSAIVTGLTLNDRYIFTLQIDEDGFELYLNETLISSGSYTSAYPIKTPTYVNGTGTGSNVMPMTINALYFTFDILSASAAIAALYDNGNSYALTTAMTNAELISGAYPHFVECRATDWELREGWEGSSGGPVLNLVPRAFSSTEFINLNLGPTSVPTTTTTGFTAVVSYNNAATGNGLMWLMAKGFDSYFAPRKGNGESRFRQENASNGQLLQDFATIDETNFAAGDDHAFIMSIGRTRGRLWLDGNLLIDATWADSDLAAAYLINSITAAGSSSVAFTLNGFWYATEEVDPATLAAVVLDANFLPTVDMQEKTAVAGVVPTEAMTSDFDTHAGFTDYS